ncbi:MAG: tRNA (adenosine(37)-N6)-threonylcarbamoyltransferase complex ATPase subunit type 1 TsaE [Candidatus Buchananbacteria bacterium RIFCSPHIGHO2_02_FULL_45_11b]|uniref:tRNA threonylcarbamoyladenosine biosynthesis protein TsaE n=2 Tax=Candidatus Buchananiibacteriota TaxID=1817903 RepID=A0A1G1YJS2_9BACT|nr:MAG: tRNA (adenosine(37)-N6)-threonylcarbamoyltransferase complex ATPase subunit type 1 TsaE [Candidatus Buchananbacteria bacterium RIFCSPHIGHO2_02_FULL_45_11b]OGY57199.1 MAG: tRNA (adenosine(37)-N6)-threonylcarbamoyltransferase complex ATPase subunit type 1 TsaE [Candidatus Buchananbacteria bacterium RIFCSPLOWO2_02_FULL_46_11b]
MSIAAKITTTSAKQTFNLGKKLAAKLRGGEVLALTGPLGAGKTVFIKGLAEGLGIKQIVTSPTFTLMKVYPLPYFATPKPRAVSSLSKESRGAKAGRPKQLIHLDCYRINDPQAIADIGAPDYFGRPDTIAVIEWAEKIKPLLTGQIIGIEIKLKGKNMRKITVK